MSSSILSRQRAAARRGRFGVPVRGQAGMTIIELIFVIGVGAFLLVPLFGLLSYWLLRREPVATTNTTAAQLRVFRSTLKADWTAARAIKLNADWPLMQCSGPGFDLNADIRIGILTSAATARRVLYIVRPDPLEPTQLNLVRRECQHVTDPVTEVVDPANWGYGASINGTSTAQPGSDRIVIRDIEDLRIAGQCNSWDAPVVPCDRNVSLLMADGQVASLRLRQETGRTS